MSSGAAVLAAMVTLTCLAFGQGVPARPGQLNDVPAAASTVSLDSAATYFDRARKLGFPAAGQTAPYILHAEFTTRASSGAVAIGTYTDTWISQ